MTKVEMEKPVVSKELAEVFEELRHDESQGPSDVCNAFYYDDELPEFENLSIDDFEDLLVRMYVLSYEVRKPKLHYIVFNDKTLDPEYIYLNSCESKHSFQLHTKDWKPNFKTQFTDEEAEEFLENTQKGMWRLEEVEDQ